VSLQQTATLTQERNDIKICIKKISASKIGKFIGTFELNTHDCCIAALGSAVLAFGLYNVHSISGVTEGGVLGLTLLLDHWFGISPAFSGFVLNAACYLIGWRSLGRRFIAYSVLASGAFSLVYKICELFPPIFPQIAEMPLLASVAGALFVGIGAGLCVRVGGATGGDDALAMSISELLHVKIQSVYLASDIAVLLLSLTYIPFRRIAYSLLTVILSGQLIGIVQSFGKNKNKATAERAAEE